MSTPHFPPEALTCNDFLGGRLQLLQPRSGYRAGIDPVLLAAAIPAKAGQSVLDLGCGAGTAALCLATRVPGLTLFGVELQAPYADLARQNAQQAGAQMQVQCGDLETLRPADLPEQLDHVLANPPFFDPEARTAAANAGRETGLAEETPLDSWFAVAARRLRPKGYLHMIHRAERLPDLLQGCAGRLGSVEILPLAPRQNRAAHLILLRARKAGKTPFRLHAPLILHQGATHLADGDDYTPEISAILRDGAALNWP